MSVFKNLKDMNIKFGFPRLEKPGMLPYSYMRFRNELVKEEYEELMEATKEKNVPEVIDALIDIMVVCAGTLDSMGVNSQSHWNEVHYANMRKKRGKSKRDYDVDIYKPDDWIGPNHLRILEENDD